jgi:hypothetical protein
MDADSRDENPTTGTGIVKKKRAEVKLAEDADEGNNAAPDILGLPVFGMPNALTFDSFAISRSAPGVSKTPSIATRQSVVGGRRPRNETSRRRAFRYC